jgi:tetrahydromethanopterin S-methyltransferase subunit G
MWEPNTIEVGLIAAGVTLLGILITNQAKVSEFRQKWIDSLREDAATLISHTLVIHAAHPGDDVNESFVQVYQTTARIRLRLNPKEEKTVAVVAAMNEMRNANHTADVEFEVLNQRIDDFTNAVQKVLKEEWKRVKFGEPLYRTIFILVIVIGVILLVSVLIQHQPLAHLIDGANRIAKYLAQQHH